MAELMSQYEQISNHSTTLAKWAAWLTVFGTAARDQWAMCKKTDSADSPPAGAKTITPLKEAHA